MEWQEFTRNNRVWIRVKHFINDQLQRFACCELCGQSPEQFKQANLSPSLKPKEQSAQLEQKATQYLLCQHCLADLPQFNQQMLQGDLLNWPSINKALPNIHFDRLICVAPYIAPFDTWLIHFKYHGTFELAALFGYLLSLQWHKANQYYYGDNLQENQQALAIIAVPLHLKKWQVRGYNQAHLIAKYFARHCQLHYIENAIYRDKANNSQVGKTGALRRKNLRNAFSLNAHNRQLPKHILLIDDVVTTGSTGSEIAKLLKQHGVKTVTLVTVCLSLPKVNKDTFASSIH